MCITIALEEAYCNSGNNNCRKVFKRLVQFFKDINLIQDDIKYNDILKELE